MFPNPLLPVLVSFITIVVLWELLWKGIALWKSARSNQMVWFIFLLIMNTVGILPIIYLAFFQKRKK
ncbi:MAG: DUF5652 family protein [Candidatus Woesearchaeota archaeon]